ncbi:MAG: ParB/RepB/Spo0J family partition protein [Lachnospiraceae bacterium]|nr:ParB/RepB/Spo0J family partition protein [Lachnospiraceae bacterium]
MKMSKRGLGKGLDALIPETEKSAKDNSSVNKTETEKEVVKEVIKEIDTIDINKIEPNATQPRKFFDEDSLQELAESIRQHGLIEPLIVQKSKEDFYSIIAGERRWRAARIAGLKDIPVIVKEYNSQQIIEIALIENLQREDLNPIEEAEAFNRLIEEYNLKQDEVAEKVSKSRVTITNSLRLLKLDERVRNMIIEDKIKSGHARALLAIEDVDEQYNAAVKIFDEKLSVRETERLVKLINSKETAPKKEEKIETQQEKLIFKQYEEKLKLVMGTKVNISHKNDGKGKIEIEYYSPEEFERLIDIMSNIN